MKKIVFFLALTCIAFSGKSQVVGLLANVGGNYATFYQNGPGAPDLTGIFTPELGLSVRTEYPTLVGFEIGGLYTKKGAKYQDSSHQVNINYVLGYIDGLIFFPLKNNDNTFVGAGLFAGSALDGKIKTDSSSSKLQFGDQWKKFDAGLRFNAGYIINNLITISLHYSISAFNVYKGIDRTGNNNHARNSDLNATISLRLIPLHRDTDARYKYW